MKNNKIALTLGLLLSTQAYAINERLIKEIPVDRLSTKRIKSQPELYLFNDSLISDKDDDTGLISDAYYTAKDDVMASVGVTTSLDPADLTKSQGYDFSLMKRMDSYKQLWWGGQFRVATAKYNAVANERTTTNADPNSVANVTRGDNQQQFTIIGLGVGHRFKTYTSLFNSHRFFEMIQVYGNYVIHKDTTNEKAYNGLGYTANYGLHYRSSNSLFFGVKLAYTFANVERKKEAEESLENRSLVFGWTNLGFEMGYFF